MRRSWNLYHTPLLGDDDQHDFDDWPHDDDVHIHNHDVHVYHHHDDYDHHNCAVEVLLPQPPRPCIIAARFLTLDIKSQELRAKSNEQHRGHGV